MYVYVKDSLKIRKIRNITDLIKKCLLELFV